MHIRVDKAAHEIQVAHGFHIAVVGHTVAFRAQAGADEHILALPFVFQAQRHGEGLPVKARVVHRDGHIVVLVALVDFHNVFLVVLPALPAHIAHAKGNCGIGYGGQGHQNQQSQHRGQAQFAFHYSLLLSGDSLHQRVMRRRGDVRVQPLQPLPQFRFLHERLPPFRR